MILIDFPICHFSKFIRRLSNDRGVAMLYTAVISMFILALFSLIHDVARISEDKIQMQNAADAAALEFATWQARGMNTVQNLNQEMYDIDTFVLTMYYTGMALTWGGNALKGVFGIGYILEGAGAGLFYAGVYIHHVIGVGMLQSLRHFYAFGTNILAYLAANEAASLNGAEPILPDFSNMISESSGGPFGKIAAAMFNNILQSIHVLCIPTSFDTMFMLPLKLEKGKNQPLNIKVSTTNGNDLQQSANIQEETDTSQSELVENGDDRNEDTPKPTSFDKDNLNTELKKGKDSLSNKTGAALDTALDNVINGVLKAMMEPTIRINTFTCFLSWDFFTWQDSYYRSADTSQNKNLPYNSPGKTSLPPVLAVVCKKQNPGLISRYLLQAKSPIPVMAYAVARCEGGNVDAYFETEHSTAFRSSPHGVSASAVLVPFSKISEAWAERHNQDDIPGFLDFMNSIFLH